MKKTKFGLLASASLAVAFVLSPVITSADTISDLQYQISVLLQKVRNLQAQLGQVQAYPNSSCYTFNTNLGIGASSEEVRTLRSLLAREQIGQPTTNFSSSYDESLASYVSQFQEKYRSEILTPAGLSHGTGYVGTRTRAKLNSLYGCGTIVNPSNPVVITGVSGPQTLNVNQQGTWTVNAYSSNGGNLTYSVRWGDENVYPTAYSPNSLSSVQSATFTHTYSQAGNYTPVFTVTSANTIYCITTPCPNNSGTAQTSVSVNVGGVISNSVVSVISPNGGEVLVKNTNQTIRWQDSSSICPPGMYCAQYIKNYDIKLISYFPPCTGTICPMYYAYPAPYTIAKNISDYSYNWTVGKVVDINNNSLTVPDGSYTVEVCQSGTSTCDSSNNYFQVVSGTITTPTTAKTCDYANPPAGYHYEGLHAYPACDAYLVAN